MAGSRLPIAVAHGEGRAEWPTDDGRGALEQPGLVAARFVDHRGRATERYPDNPNGSPGGITALTTPDGRVTILMPHPERVFRAVQYSWRPRAWREDAPWMRMFRNARGLGRVGRSAADGAVCGYVCQMKPLLRARRRRGRGRRRGAVGAGV